MLAAGHVVERYRLVSPLGEGGMAVVWLVEHEKLGTRHALKVLTIANREVQRRTLQEGKLQATLRHPNIVAVTDVLDVDGAPALLMEYIEGPTLDTWLHTYKPSQEEALALFRGVIAGVRHAHDLGLVHRDLKPANVMLQPAPEGIVPKVTDFGLAKALSADENVKKTRAGATMGTPAYMAPEQIRDASSVDRRADVYSLGCILYELVCGRPPYEATDILALFPQVAAGDYPPPETIVPDLPGAVRDAIAGALKVDPADRIPDCATFVDVLYAMPGTPPASKTLISGVTLIGDSAAIQAIHTLAQVRRDSIAPSMPESGGTWLDPAAATPAPAANVTRMVSPATPAEPAARARPSVTSFGEQSQPPTTRLAWGLVPLLAAGAIGVALIGGVAVVASVASVAYTHPGDAAEAPITVAPPRATTSPPIAAVPPIPTEPQVDALPVATAPLAAPVVVAPVDPPVAKLRDPKVHPVDAAPKPIDAPPKPVDPPVTVAPEPAAPTGATFSFTGATDVVLTDAATGEHYGAAAQVPPGTYKIRATFDGPDPVEAGRVTLAAGQAAVLKCNAAFAQCKRQ